MSTSPATASEPPSPAQALTLSAWTFSKVRKISLTRPMISSRLKPLAVAPCESAYDLRAEASSDGAGRAASELRAMALNVRCAGRGAETSLGRAVRSAAMSEREAGERSRVRLEVAVRLCRRLNAIALVESRPRECPRHPLDVKTGDVKR